MNLTLNKDFIKNVFILEDNEERITWFKKTFDFANLFITKLAGVAIERLKVIKYDIIFLDHDLGSEHYGEDDLFNNGCLVAESLSYSINKYTPVIIHSSNYPAALRMESTLILSGSTTSVRIPFPELMKTIEINESTKEG